MTSFLHASRLPTILQTIPNGRNVPVFLPHAQQPVGKTTSLIVLNPELKREKQDGCNDQMVGIYAQDADA